MEYQLWIYFWFLPNWHLKVSIWPCPKHPYNGQKCTFILGIKYHLFLSEILRRLRIWSRKLLLVHGFWATGRIKKLCKPGYGFGPVNQKPRIKTNFWLLIRNLRTDRNHWSFVPKKFSFLAIIRAFWFQGQFDTSRCRSKNLKKFRVDTLPVKNLFPI